VARVARTWGARLPLRSAWLLAGLTLSVGLALSQTASAQIASGTTTPGIASSSFPKPAGGITGPAQRLDQAQPLYLTGDELVYDNKNTIVRARGNVEIYYNNYVLTADEVIYDQAANTLTAIGNVALSDPNGNISRSERLTLTDDFRDGFIQSLSVVARDGSRIEGRSAERRDGDTTVFRDAKYTPCKVDPGKPPLWCISAAQIVHDQRAATISYQDAVFQLLGQPIIYLPFFQHPDPSVKRRSGFLLPDAGHSSKLGFQFEIPYYFALAPNYDFTFHPRITTREGVLWKGDWRHRLRIGDVSGEYDINIAAIDQQTSLKDAGVTSRLPDNWRGSVETRGKFSLSSWWNFGWDITVESDDTFRRYYGLDNILKTDRVNQVFLKGISEKNYLSINAYQFGALTFTPSNTAESRTMPIVDYYRVDRAPVIGGEFNLTANATSFTRSDGSIDARSTSTINRASADLTWRRRLTDMIGIEYTPFANARGDIIGFTDVTDPQNNTAIESKTVTRGVVSAGVLAAYPWVAHTANSSHVLEPIGQVIVRTARVDQARLPDEDARSLVFADINLFDINKFSGWDRVETGTRVNTGLQYTFQLNTGGHLRVLGGQSYHIAGNNPYSTPGIDVDKAFIYSPVSGLQRSKSDYVFGAYFSPAAAFQLIGQARFDERTFAVRRADAIAQASYGPIYAQGIYSRSVFEPFSAVVDGTSITQLGSAQQEAIGLIGLRLTDRWSVQASLRYDIDNRKTLQDQYVIRYADECFVLSATYTETNITSTNLDLRPDRSIMFRFELKNLGAYGFKTGGLDNPIGLNQPQR
jgi:LPS-assembly protein